MDQIQIQFERFDAANPQVYEEIVRRARQMKVRGYRHYGMHTILHVIRWHTDMKTAGEPFKINNNYSSRYARKLISEYPEFEGFFSTRTLKGGDSQ